jgi:4-carboxymuconolactone decarboxylase
LFEKGLQVRREVAGADLVERAFATTDESRMPMQELLTEYRWAQPGTEGGTSESRP